MPEELDGGGEPTWIPEDSIDPSEIGGLYLIDHFGHDDVVFQTLQPENPDFELNVREPDTITYEISFSQKDLDGNDVVFRDPVDGTPFIGPYRTGWRLRYSNVELGGSFDTTISEGWHTMTNSTLGDDFMKVAGKSWLDVFNRSSYPFNPQTPNTHRLAVDINGNIVAATLNNPPVGTIYQIINPQVQRVLTHLFDKIFSGVSPQEDRPPITRGTIVCPTVVQGYYRLDLGDTRTFMQIVSQLSEHFPGFDFIVDNGKVFKIFVPYRFGKPENIAGNPAHQNLVYTVDSDSPAISTEFTNTGPQHTHLLTEGAGTSFKLGRALGDNLNQEEFWRLDRTLDVGEIKNQDQLNSRAQQEFVLGLNPIHEIPLSIDVAEFQAETGMNFWATFKPGRAIWVDLDFVYHRVNSAQRIVSIKAAPDNEGNCEASFGLNQIYNGTTQYGVQQA